MPRVTVARLAAAAALLPSLAGAHESAGRAEAPAWWVVAAMVLSGVLYAVGWWRLRRRASRTQRTWSLRGAAFAGGWLALALALLSPLDALGARLFSAHMLQHELLMVVAAPLMVAGLPLGVWAWALALPTRRAAGAWLHRPAWRAVWRVLCRPAVAWALHAIALWAWHAPALFDAAVHDETWHTLQHTSFFASALLYWWTVLNARTRSAQGVAIVSLFTTMMHSGALGALLALSPQPWYPAYFDTAMLSGFAPLEDQQLGGLLMWIPASLVYLAVGLALAVRWGGFVAGDGRAQTSTPRTSSSM